MQKWHTILTLKIKDFSVATECLLDSGADVNVLREGLIPTKYFEKTNYTIGLATNKDHMQIRYKLNNAHVCLNGQCIKTNFIIGKGLTNNVILGTPFLTKLQPFTVDSDGFNTTFNNTQLLFKFINTIQMHELNKIQTDITFKTNNISHLKQRSFDATNP